MQGEGTKRADERRREKTRDTNCAPTRMVEDETGQLVCRTERQGLLIEKGVERRIYWSNGVCEVLRRMDEAGDSVWVPGARGRSMATLVAKLRKRMALDGVRRRWSVRAGEGGVRVWREE